MGPGSIGGVLVYPRWPLLLSVAKSDEPFRCAHCKINMLQLELNSVRDQMTSLANKVTALCDEITSLKSCSTEHPAGLYTAVAQPNGVKLVLDAAEVPTAMNQPVTWPHSTSMSERKFNILVYGVEESPEGTFRKERQYSDLEKSSSILSIVDPAFESASIRDHLRLGKYKRGSSRPRPILVKLNRTADVASLLSKRGVLKSPLSIKADKSPHERIRDAVLLKERWSFLHSGTDKRRVKIRGSCLFLDSELYAQFKDGMLSYASNGISQSQSVNSYS